MATLMPLNAVEQLDDGGYSIPIHLVDQLTDDLDSSFKELQAYFPDHEFTMIVRYDSILIRWRKRRAHDV